MEYGGMDEVALTTSALRHEETLTRHSHKYSIIPCIRARIYIMKHHHYPGISCLFVRLGEMS